jgi:CHASE3 domain sensor protein
MRWLDVLESIAAQKMSELSETINVRHAGQVDAALAVVRSDRGKNYMDRIRAAFVRRLSRWTVWRGGRRRTNRGRQHRPRP